MQHVCCWEAELYFREPSRYNCSQLTSTPRQPVNTVSVGNPTLCTTTLHPSQRTGCSHLGTDSAPLGAGNVRRAPTSLHAFCTFGAGNVHQAPTLLQGFCTFGAGNVHRAPTSLYAFCTSRRRQCSSSADISTGRRQLSCILNIFCMIKL